MLELPEKNLLLSIAEEITWYCCNLSCIFNNCFSFVPLLKKCVFSSGEQKELEKPDEVEKRARKMGAGDSLLRRDLQLDV